MSEVVYITIEQPQQTPVDGIIQTQPDWIHPHLIESADPVKGRQLRVSHLVPEGICLLVDRPYAVIPVVDEPAVNDNLICSSPACNRRAPRHNTGRCPCPNACIPDVVWCSSACRDADRTRHAFECTWLKRYARTIQTKWGEYDFGMLWVIVRLLATRHVEIQDPSVGAEVAQLKSRQWRHGWDGIGSLCGSADTWSHDKVRSWNALVKKYLQSSTALPHGMSTDRILHLICQEEANSFGLYPRETGIFPLLNPPIDRGEQFAAAVYPTAAMANHSCSPNIIHKPDDQGRMVFTASRDILPGEECCISYFDLTKHTDVSSRREHLRKTFRFVCRCDRCSFEEPANETTEWAAMPQMDIL